MAAAVQTVPIVCTHKLDKQFFDSHTEEMRVPKIFRGVDIGACTSKWNAGYLAESLGDAKTTVHVCAEEKLDFITKNFQYKTLEFREYIRRSSRPLGQPLDDYFLDPHEKYYLRSLGEDVRKDTANIHEQHQQIAKDLILPQVFLEKQFFSSVLRIASPCSQLWTHYDVMDNILIQVVGSKDILLFPPEDYPYLYMRGDKSTILDPDNVDPLKYPLYCKTSPYRATLQPGDIIYIPALWFHNVKARDFSVAVNVFWKNLDASFYDSRDVYGNKDLMPAARAQQGVDKAIKTLSTLPAQYKHFFTLKIIAKLQQSLDG